MPTFYILGKLAENPRGKRLQKFLAATPTIEPPEGVGLCLGSGQDYQTKTLGEQRKWVAWAARPGCAVLLIPPFQTAARHEPSGWEFASQEKPLVIDQSAHSVLRLTQPEIGMSLAHGLTRTLNQLIEGGTRSQLSGLFRKHPDSGIFAVTAVPVWSLALADHVAALIEWLSAWVSLAGQPADATKPVEPAAFEPTQRHYSVLLYLASGNFPDRAAAVEALAWNDTFELGDADVTSLLDDLQSAGLAVDGALTAEGRRSLLESPYRHYAEAYLNPPSHL